ncbi:MULTISPECIES: LLM class flavin-dependent oxidoreductase [unclassified Rhodococcus (in: high G+C Gram-positive bacteria)]|uniref:LLM class flavin-dependent oxidoreductase n=1 Tax=unclassified Rhodococcus (in: high G+C Gram-positive bacteria) TaxID=192944 RepID=UPI001639A787|nr:MULTISPECIES: LLM class flavin-dependent oxidoreductase [unclassified Rhodococcus (in: high G+C Gram-positive bacteria)]MBC2639610.1 LLM class flavin-dependent oxidoreductase [Rhodococcus sp. 3A]MBC2895644.1 LLM class flavin-dependent oxidoreductase [Rhodococcus sp. 4CII]
MSEPRSPLVAVDLYGTGIHPQSWRRPDSRAEDLFTAGYWTGLLAQADAAGVDLAFLGDSFAIATTGHAEQRGHLDAVAIAARTVAATDRIGLVPTVTVTHTEPFHVSKAIASLDHASRGRAGWQVDVSAGQAQANLFGRKDAQGIDSLWEEAADAIEVVSLLWDSWEDDAEIRDVATGRFIDRDKLHYIDFEGSHFTVKGPSITPRSPQGQSVVVIEAREEHSARVAAARADVIRIGAPGVEAARQRAVQVRTAAAEAGRDPGSIRVLLDVEVVIAESADTADHDLAQLENWSGSRYEPQSLLHRGDAAGLARLIADVVATGDVDGVTLRPLALASGLDAITAHVLPLLRSEAPVSGRGNLRERLGLTRPVNHFAGQD